MATQASTESKYAYFKQGDNVLVKAVPVLKSASKQLSVVVVDVSASMESWMSIVCASLADFLQKAEIGCALRLITFSNDAKLVFSTDSLVDSERVLALTIATELKVESSTNLEIAFQKCNSVVKEACAALEIEMKAANVLLLSDGDATAGFGAHDRTTNSLTKLFDQLIYGRFFLLNFNSRSSIILAEVVRAKHQRVYYAEDVELRATFLDALDSIAGVPVKLTLTSKDDVAVGYTIPAENTASGMGFAMFTHVVDDNFELLAECNNVQSKVTAGVVGVDVESESVLGALFDMQAAYQKLRNINIEYGAYIDNNDVKGADENVFDDKNVSFVKSVADSDLGSFVEDFVNVKLEDGYSASQDLVVQYRSLSSKAKELSKQSSEVKRLASAPPALGKRHNQTLQTGAYDDIEDNDDVPVYRSLGGGAAAVAVYADDTNPVKPTFKGSRRVSSYSQM
jgi:hypothetical protein